MSIEVPRRERLRAEAYAEIEDLAMRQVARGGPGALSLNAVARDMGMSGPAIYRYFASRAELLARLVANALDQVAAAAANAAAGASGRQPEHRFRARAAAYREWALAHPREYELLTVHVADERGRALMEPPAQRALDGLTGALLALAAQDGTAPEPAWLRSAGVIAWQRMHGHLALELEGIHAAMGIDSAALWDREIGTLVDEFRMPRATAPEAA